MFRWRIGDEGWKIICIQFMMKFFDVWWEVFVEVEQAEFVISGGSCGR